MIPNSIGKPALPASGPFKPSFDLSGAVTQFAIDTTSRSNPGRCKLPLKPKSGLNGPPVQLK